MAFLIDEKNFIDDNVFQYENKLKSPLARYQDQTPTYVTYYHISNDDTLVDAGFKDVQSIIGNRSPIRFDEIKNFPIYGIEPVVLQLQNLDQGLDTTYEGDAVILHSTLKPLPNDHFIIPILHDTFLFRVTNIEYDAALPENFYKINYMLEWIDDEKVKELKKQVGNECTCVLDNIGTDKSVIIQDAIFDKIDKVKTMYEDIASTYMSMFYSDRHNCFLGEIEPNKFVYDALQTEFINKHNLFVTKRSFQTVYLTDQYTDPKRRLKYEKSVYRFIERQNKDLMSNFKFVIYSGLTQHETTFYRWHANNIFIMDAPSNPEAKGTINTFSDEFVFSVKVNATTNNSWQALLQSYIRAEKLTLDDIDLTMNEILLDLDGNIEYFLFVPMVLYILKNIMNNSTKVKN